MPAALLILPWIGLFLILGTHASLVQTEVLQGLNENVDHPWVILKFWGIASAALVAFTLAVPEKYRIGPLFTALLASAAIYTKNHDIAAVALVAGYLFCSYRIAELLVRKRSFSQPIETLVISFWVNFLMTSFFYLIGAGATQIYPYAISICGWIWFFWALAGPLRKKTIPTFFRKGLPSSRSVLAAQNFLALSAMIPITLLSLQPILEWDSNVGHMPLIRYYVRHQSISPSPFILQSYFVDLFHVSSLPFFSLAGTLGLKLFNLVFFYGISAAFIGVCTLLRKDSPPPSRLTAEAAILFLLLTNPLVLTTVGTIQYDTALLFPAISSLFLLIRYLFFRRHSRSLVFLALSLGMGVLIKPTFLSFVVLCSFITLPIAWRRRDKLVLPSALLTLIVALGPIKILLSKPSIPFSTFKSIVKTDLLHFGMQTGSLITKFLLYVPMATLHTSRYMQAHDFAFGFGILLSLFCGVLLISKNKDQRPYQLILAISLGSLLIGISQTQYLRYSVFLLCPLLFLLLNWHDRASALKPLLAKAGIAMMVLLGFLQIALAPDVNWWIKVPGTALSRKQAFNENEFLAQIRGPSWEDWRSVTQRISTPRTLFLSPTFADAYYWVANVDVSTQIIPGTWQSNLGDLLSTSGDGFLRKASELGFETFISPTKELQDKEIVGKFQALQSHCSITWSSNLFTAWSGCVL